MPSPYTPLHLDAQRQAVAQRQARTPIEAMRALARMRPRPPSLFPPASELASIGWFGWIAPPLAPALRAAAAYDPVAQALRFAHAGFDGVQVCAPECDSSGVNDLTLIAQAVPTLPILFDTLLIEEYQLVEASAAGAAAVMLEADVLDGDLARFVSTAHRHRVGAVVRVRDPRWLPHALASGAMAIALGERNARGELDLAEALAARTLIAPPMAVIIAESIDTLHEAASAAQLYPDAIAVRPTLTAMLQPLRQRAASR